MRFRRKVKHGSKTGRKIGFPTLNFNVGSFKESYQPGVYVCTMEINKKTYNGALYFGPKMHSKIDTLEVFIFDFSDNIYGQFVYFSVDRKLRKPIKFNGLEDLKCQIKKDLKGF